MTTERIPVTHPVRPWYAADPCTCAKPRSTPEFADHERATLARIEAAEPAPESYRPLPGEVVAGLRAALTALSLSEPTPGTQA